jgi:hypothetical protein
MADPAGPSQGVPHRTGFEGHHELVCPSCGRRVGGCRCVGGHNYKIKDTRNCPECEAGAYKDKPAPDPSRAGYFEPYVLPEKPADPTGANPVGPCLHPLWDSPYEHETPEQWPRAVLVQRCMNCHFVRRV